VAWAEAYLRTKWHLDSFNRLATIDMGRKLGAVPFFGEGSWVPIQYNVAWAESYLRAKCYIDPFSRLATIDMGGKLGAQTLFGEEGTGFGPYLTQCRFGRGLAPYQMGS